MNRVQIEQQSYEMPPRDGFTIAHFLTVADIDRSARFYEKVFGGRVLSRGDREARRRTFRSRIRGFWSTSEAGRPPTSRR